MVAYCLNNMLSLSFNVRKSNEILYMFRKRHLQNAYSAFDRLAESIILTSNLIQCCMLMASVRNKINCNIT